MKVDVELNAEQVAILNAIAQHEGKELHEVVEEAVTRYADGLRAKSPAELEAYIDAMRMHPEGSGR